MVAASPLKGKKRDLDLAVQLQSEGKQKKCKGFEGRAEQAALGFHLGGLDGRTYRRHTRKFIFAYRATARSAWEYNAINDAALSVDHITAQRKSWFLSSHFCPKTDNVFWHIQD